MSVQVYREDDEICIDKGGHRVYLDEVDARDLLLQLGVELTQSDDVSVTDVGPVRVEPIDWPNVRWEAWSDGYVVGYKATHTDGRVEYVYLSASGDDLVADDDGSPCAFLYHDSSGDPADGATVCYIDMFTSEPDVDPES